MNMISFLPVIGGAALGASFRYWIGEQALCFGIAPGISVLWINIFGCLLAGGLFGYFSADLGRENLVALSNVNIKLFLITGFLGSFTTFSAYSVEILRLLQNGETGKAGLYFAASAMLCVISAIIGAWFVRSFL